MSTTVHPRIRGERLAKSPRNSHTAGSSPHTRGTHSARLADPQDDRFIPAYAGNAPVSAAARLPATVHPRIRGERVNAGNGKNADTGSSPHTRGTPIIRKAAYLKCRFIPAYAGNARSPAWQRPSPAVHPRIRGERLAAVSGLTARNGSSPHTRGTLIVCPRWCAAQRFIPAYAGNAPAVLTERGGPAVHPRIRGERSGFGSFSVAGNGSSPHTRGTHGYWFLHDAQTRFIPAYAGNASWRSCHPRRWPVHPRIRGERVLTVSTSGALAGSSPHTRGTPAPPGQGPARRRFIPAYAGNATSCEHTSTRPTVHPRIRGERPDHR